MGRTTTLGPARSPVRTGRWAGRWVGLRGGFAAGLVAGWLVVPGLAQAAYTSSGSARVCGAIGAQSFECVQDDDQPAAVVSVGGHASDSGHVDPWLSFPGGDYAGTAWYGGSLATGALRVYAQAQGAGLASAGVRVRDSLSFSGLAVAGSTIRFELAVSGLTDWDAAPGLPALPGTFQGSAGLFAMRGSSVVKSASANFSVHDGVISRVVVLEVPLTSAAPTIDLAATLTAQVNVYNMNGATEGGGTMDLGHTGLLSVVLPAGVTMSSSSGVFLSQPVPEPGTAAMGLAGLAALAGWVGRARRRGAGQSPAAASGSVSHSGSVVRRTSPSTAVA